MMPHWVQKLLDWTFPPKDDVRIAKNITEDGIANLFHPKVVREAWIIALLPYTDWRIRSLIRSVKFYGEKTPLPLVGRVVSEYVLETVSDKKLFSGWSVPLLIPMPTSAKRLRERGYNQVERLAENMMPFLDGVVEYSPNVLQRKERPSQVRIERSKRENNIKGAFFVQQPKLVQGRQIILLDDVVESGATLQDARRACLEAGAADVLGIAIAH